MGCRANSLTPVLVAMDIDRLSGKSVQPSKGGLWTIYFFTVWILTALAVIYLIYLFGVWFVFNYPAKSWSQVIYKVGAGLTLFGLLLRLGWTVIGAWLRKLRRTRVEGNAILRGGSRVLFLLVLSVMTWPFLWAWLIKSLIERVR